MGTELLHTSNQLTLLSLQIVLPWKKRKKFPGIKSTLTTVSFTIKIIYSLPPCNKFQLEASLFSTLHHAPWLMYLPPNTPLTHWYLKCFLLQKTLTAPAVTFVQNWCKWAVSRYHHREQWRYSDELVNKEEVAVAHSQVCAGISRNTRPLFCNPANTMLVWLPPS